MNQSNCVKSSITKILNTQAQVLKIKWLQRTQESMNNDMLHIHNSSSILILKFQGMCTQPTFSIDKFLINYLRHFFSIMLSVLLKK